jgi:ubiquinone/menaquinone biosynthesis C-methylase UbiE
MDSTPTFDDGVAYERFMGRWSRAAGEAFLEWIRPSTGCRWLDVGCGGGAFTELVFARCSPAAVCGIDPAKAQVGYARAGPVGKRAEFRVAAAEKLPFPDASFDIVTSALVINFIPDRPKALLEMRRVARVGGLVAGYVWDFAGERSVLSPIRLAMQRIGRQPPRSAGAEDSTLEQLAALFRHVGLTNIATKPIDIRVTYPDFHDFWRAQTPSFNPLTQAIAALSHGDRAEIVDLVKEAVGTPDGSIVYSARANAIMARVPN